MSLPGTAVQGRSFDNYFTRIFNPHIKHDLSRSARVDVIWDDYRKLSIKGSTREKRGDGTRQHVTASAKVLKDWHAFLTHSENKKELVAFLSQETEHTQFLDGKDIYITSGKLLSNLLFRCLPPNI